MRERGALQSSGVSLAGDNTLAAAHCRLLHRRPAHGVRATARQVTGGPGVVKMRLRLAGKIRAIRGAITFSFFAGFPQFSEIMLTSLRA